MIHDALGDFRLDAHRIETVAVAGGIRWIDDSKATNPHAAEASLRAFGTVVWIVGGLLKGVDVDALVAAHVDAAARRGRDRRRPSRARRGVRDDTRPNCRVFEVVADDTETVMPDAVALAAAVAEAGRHRAPRAGGGIDGPVRRLRAIAAGGSRGGQSDAGR